MTDTLDPKTRTIGVVVEVDEPYGDVMPGSRPPLIKGFFVEVHLTGIVRKDSLVVPRSAIHNEHLYLVNKDNRLQIKKVSIDLLQAEFAVVSGDISKDDILVISDLVPAIKGMMLSPQTDLDTSKRLNNIVQGVQ